MKAFVIDMDGVMTDGRMWYTKEGKMMKAFGPDDHDALEMLRGKINIVFVTADKLGWQISERRAKDMNFPLGFVPMKDRIAYIDSIWGLGETIYMGDGILDGEIFDKVAYSICPADGFYLAKERASYVTRHNGGHRALAEACVHIKEKFEL